MSIIKCPECGHNVSTMAGTCPSCGVRIEGNLHKCPECGEYYVGEPDVCPQCGYRLPARKSEPKQEPVQVQETPQPKEAPKTEAKTKNHGCGCFGFFTIFLLLLIFFATVVVSIPFAFGNAHDANSALLFYINLINSDKQEEAEYSRLQNVTNPDFYQQFLDKYPNSLRRAEVRERMEKLIAEEKEWEETARNGNRQMLAGFLSKYPSSVRSRECNNRIDSLDWEEALQDTTGKAIDLYLENHPEGAHAEEAASKKNELARTRITKEDRAVIRGIFEAFFANGLGNQDTAQIAELILSPMEDFCGQESATPQQIAAFTGKKVVAGVEGIHYSIGTGMNIRRETLTDGSMGYAVDFMLDEVVNHTDASKAGNQKYLVGSNLDANMKIVRMRITQQ